MTTIRALNQFENNLTFEMLETTEFNPYDKLTKVQNVNIELTESADDTVMLNADNAHVQGKEGNNTIYLSGTKNTAKAGDGTNKVALWGTNNSAITGYGNDFMYVEGDNNKVESLGGNNIFRVYGDNNIVTAGDGNNEVGVLGSTNNISLSKGNNFIGYYGDNNKINMGDGNSSAMTLDYAIIKGKLHDMENRWMETLGYHNTSERVPINTVYDYSTATNAIVAYLSDAERQYFSEHDLTEMVEDKPKYVLGDDGTGKVRLYKYAYSYQNNNYYYPIGEEGEQTSKRVINSVAPQTVSYDKYDYYTMQYYKNYEIDGVSGNTVTFGKGNNNISHTVKDNTNNVDLNQATNGHTVNQQTAYTFAEQENKNFTQYTRVETQFYVVAG